MNAPVAPINTQQPKLPIGRNEFIALTATMMALNALAIDIMLPGLQQIGEALGVADENSRQIVISAYMAGFGIAQLFFGPISDRFGRRGPLLFGLVIYIISAFACAFAPSFGTLLAFRFMNGIGAAATRVISVSAIRDIYGGRKMAEVMSLVMMVFMIIPVIAPGMGQVAMLLGDWTTIFHFVGIFALLVSIWIFFRLPETMPPGMQRPLSFRSIAEGFRIVLTNRIALCYTLASTAIFGALFGFINSAQQIYVQIYDLGNMFSVAFAVGAGLMAISSFTNSRLVGRFGMRKLSHGSLIGFLLTSGIWLALALMGPISFPVFFTLFSIAMFQFGWVGSNFNSIAMEPLGRVAGTAAAVLGTVSTIGGGLFGAFIGLAYNGTVIPLAVGYFLLGLIALILVLIGERGKLFHSVNAPVE